MTGKGKFPNETCSERIGYDSWGHSKACEQPVTTHEDGKPWCTIHAPSYVARKQAEREARLDAHRAVDRKRWQEESRNKDRLALYPKMVEALAEMLEHYSTPTEVRNPRSYSRTNKQVATDARAVLTQAAAIEVEGKG